MYPFGYGFRQPFEGFYGLLLISLHSILVTPNFSSLRIKIIFFPVFLLLVHSGHSLTNSLKDRKSRVGRQ
jgi:hypothetical protein